MINDKGVRSSVDHLDFSQPPRSYEPLIVEELLYKENKKNRSKVHTHIYTRASSISRYRESYDEK